MYLYVLYIFTVCVTFSTTIQFILFVLTSILFCCNWLTFVTFNSMSDYLDPVFIPNQYFRTYSFYPYLKKFLAFKNKRILSIKDLPTINMQHVSIIFHHCYCTTCQFFCFQCYHFVFSLLSRLQ